MINKLIVISFLTLMFAASYLEAKDQLSDICWGDKNCGAQLSIDINKKVIVGGSTVLLCIRTKNISTNLIFIIPKNSEVFLLTNNIGECCRAIQLRQKTPIVIDVNTVPVLDIQPGGTNEITIPIRFETGIKSGDYTFSPITEDILIGKNDRCKLTSNALIIHVN